MTANKFDLNRISVLIFIVTVCLFLAPAYARDLDPCARTLEMACNTNYLSDSTGYSYNGAQEPHSYKNLKTEFIKRIRAKLISRIQREEWSAAIEFILKPPTQFNSSIELQDEKSQQAIQASCLNSKTSSICIDSYLAGIVKEIEFNVFLGMDVMYRAENNKNLPSGDEVRVATLYSRLQPSQISQIERGTVLKTVFLESIFKIYPSLKKIVNETVLELIPEVLPAPDIVDRFNATVVPLVKGMIEQLVNEQKNDFAQAALSKISATQYHDLDLTQLNSENTLDFKDFFIADASYLPTKNTLAFSPGYFISNTSLFGNFYLAAHEFSHSIDPCTIGKPYEGQFWLPNVISYLRNNLKIFDFQRRGSAAIEYPFCNKADQIGESTADLIAAEVLARYLKNNWSHLNQTERMTAVAQSLRPFRCDLVPTLNNSHLPTKERYSKLILANPGIRNFLGCQ